MNKFKNKSTLKFVRFTLNASTLALSLVVFSCSPTKVSNSGDSLNQESPTTQKNDELSSVLPNAPKPTVSFYSNQLKDLAAKSSCSQFNWANRGKSPAGYIKGMTLSYARSLCRIKAIGVRKPAAIILSSVNSKNPATDVLAHYQDFLAKAGISTDVSGDEPLHATYTIGMGLGMRESSGKYCEGWDVAAGSNRTSAEAEAGLFQVSYDSVAASAELGRLYEEYKANPKRCLLEVFKDGVTCRPRGVLGSGAGAVYQEFNLKCPAFATEYAMTLLRLRRSHFGPINRKAAQIAPACDSLLKRVQQIVNQDPDAVCSELF